MFEENSTIIGVMPKRADKIKDKLRTLVEIIAPLLVAAVFAYGLLSLIGLVFYLWWFAGVFILLTIVLGAVCFLLWKLQ